MFCPKCGSEVQEGSAFCGKCGAPVGGARQAAPSSAGMQVGGAPTPKKSTAKIGIIAAAAVVVVVLVAGLATNWFGLAGVQPKEAVDVPAASEQDSGGSEGEDGGAPAAGDDAQQGSNASVKSAVEAYTWGELSQISSEIAAAGGEDAAIEVAKRYNLCTPDGKLDGTQVKSVTLTDGTQTTVQIVGFAHDDKTSGGKAGITFIFGGYMGRTDMDADATNAGGWEKAPIRAWLNTEGMNLLPDDLRNAVVPVDKLTNNTGESDTVSSVSVTSDTLWLFSDNELGGTTFDWVHEGNENALSVLDAEGSEYKLMHDMGVAANDAGDCSILVRKDGEDNGYWWGRTPNPDMGPNEYGFTPYQHYFLLVSYDGTPSFSTEAEGPNLGVVPGFCI